MLKTCPAPPLCQDWGFNLFQKPAGLLLEAICQTTALITTLWEHWNQTSSFHHISLSCWLPHLSLLLYTQRTCAISCFSVSVCCRGPLMASQSIFQICLGHLCFAALMCFVCICRSSQTSMHLWGVIELYQPTRTLKTHITRKQIPKNPNSKKVGTQCKMQI